MRSKNAETLKSMNSQTARFAKWYVKILDPKVIDYSFAAKGEKVQVQKFQCVLVSHAPEQHMLGLVPFDFKDRSAAHLGYFFGRDMYRWAEVRGLPMIRHRPTHHDNPLALANGAIIAAGTLACALSRAILQAHWRDDADVADADVVARLAEGVGLEGAALVAAAQSGPVQDAHRANTEKAIALSVFGSPTYFVEGDMFYGQDRLFMVERALRQPFAP